jgi:hypothetical protein
MTLIIQVIGVLRLYYVISTGSRIEDEELNDLKEDAKANPIIIMWPAPGPRPKPIAKGKGKVMQVEGEEEVESRVKCARCVKSGAVCTIPKGKKSCARCNGKHVACSFVGRNGNRIGAEMEARLNNLEDKMDTLTGATLDLIKEFCQTNKRLNNVVDLMTDLRGRRTEKKKQKEKEWKEGEAGPSWNPKHRRQEEEDEEDE